MALPGSTFNGSNASTVSEPVAWVRGLVVKSSMVEGEPRPTNTRFRFKCKGGVG